MARDFTKNTANYMTIGTGSMLTAMVGAAKLAFHAWVNLDTLDTGANDNRAFGFFVNAGLIFFGCSVDGSVTPKVFATIARSNGTDALAKKSATTEFTTGTWHSIGGVVDYGAGTITPYFKGVAEGGGGVTFGNTTLQTGTPTSADALGGGISPPTQTLQLDGRLAEFACWKDTVPSAADFAGMAAGASPLFFASTGFVDYWRLVGYQSPEGSYRSTRVGTITGTVAADVHPRIIMPRGRNRSMFPAVVAAAGEIGHRIIGGGWGGRVIA